MTAWLESPYRAVGIYLGGQNRACPDGNLTPQWINSVRAQGWSLLPLWVGLQAPCVSQSDLARISPASAASQGRAAAVSASERALYFGIGPGYPIYFDMEGYPANNASCSTAVKNFLGAWTDELHARGYVSGVYGSAASTIRDIVDLYEAGGSAPDDIWIARWNGVQDVFGEPEVPDEYWANHERIHQYQGGHKETYGGVTINIDSNYVDGAAVEAAAVLPTEAPYGTITSSDGLASVTFWEQSFDVVNTTLTLTSSTLATETQGFAAGSYLLQLAAIDNLTATPLSRFNTLLDLRVNGLPAGAVPAYSMDGLSWVPIKRLDSPAVPVGQANGYQILPDGSVHIYTLVPGWFGLLVDIQPPISPATLKGRMDKRKLVLTWPAAEDNSAQIASYQITLNGAPLQTVAGGLRKATVTKFRKKGLSVYRVKAIDAAGNQSGTSRFVKVKPKLRPKSAPKQIPRWAWKLFTWQQTGKKGKRPKAKLPLPSWYWRWASWQVNPYRIVG